MSKGVSRVVSADTAMATGMRNERSTPRLTPRPAMMNENSPICARLIPDCTERRTPLPATNEPTLTPRTLPHTTTAARISTAPACSRMADEIDQHADGHEEHPGEDVADGPHQAFDQLGLARFGHQGAGQEGAEGDRVAGLVRQPGEGQGEPQAGHEQGLGALAPRDQPDQPGHDQHPARQHHDQEAEQPARGLAEHRRGHLAAAR